MSPSLPRRAFTLTELLVVIAIVGVLAGLLLPLGYRARQQALGARCLGNLRAVGSGLAAFVADNRGFLPPRTVQTPSVPVNPPEVERYWTSRLVRSGHLADRNSLYCPACFPYTDAGATERIEDTGGQTYGMRVWSLPEEGWNNRWRDHRLNSIENPGAFFLVADSIWINASTAGGQPTQGYGINPSSASTDNQRVHLRHGGRANTLFADFHVEAKSAGYFLDEVPRTQAAYNNNTLKFSVTDGNDL